MVYKNVQVAVGVLGIYIVLAIVMTWSVTFYMTSSLAGNGGDPWQTLWRFETKELEMLNAFQQGTVGIYLKTEFLGSGEPRLVNLSVWPWMSLHMILGEPVTYNLVFLLTFILSGFGMYLFVRLLTVDTPPLSSHGAAFLAGILYMFLPFHVAHASGHFGAMQIQWIPFILCVTLWLYRNPSIGKAILLGLLLIIQGWSEHHYMLWLGLFAGLTAIYFWRDIYHTFQTTSKTKKVPIIGIVLFSILLLGVSYLPTAKLAFADQTPLSLGKDQTIRFSADIASYVVPAPFHSVWGSMTNSLFSKSFTGNVAESTLYVGIIPLLFILFFHASLSKISKGFWLGVALFFLIISLGPRLHVFGVVLPIPLPYELIDSWPIFSSVRAVARAGVMVGVAMAVLFGLVAATQIRRWQNIGIFAILLLVEFLFFPMPTQSSQLSEAYQVVSHLPGKTLIEIPAATNYTIASRALYASTVHGKEVMNTIALERAQSDKHFETFKQLPVIRQLLYLRTTELRQDRPEFFGQNLAETFPDAIAWADASAIMLHTDSLSVLQLNTIRTFLEQKLGLHPQQFMDVLLYEIPPTTTLSSDHVFAMRGDGWENIGFDPDKNSVFAEVPSTAELVLVNTSQDTIQTRLQFLLTEESGEGSLTLDGTEITSFSPGQDNQVNVTVSLPPGTHSAIFQAASKQRVIIKDPHLTGNLIPE